MQMKGKKNEVKKMLEYERLRQGKYMGVLERFIWATGRLGDT